MNFIERRLSQSTFKVSFFVDELAHEKQSDPKKTWTWCQGLTGGWIFRCSKLDESIFKKKIIIYFEMYSLT